MKISNGRTYAEVPTDALSSVIICTTFSVRSRGNLINERPGTYLLNFGYKKY